MKIANLFQTLFPEVKSRNSFSILSKSAFVFFLLLSLLGTSVTNVSANADSAKKTCFSLTLAYTGTGSKLVASPIQSTGCPVGKYKAGQSIKLTAKPANGWEVGSWTGTDNNLSTTTTNVVTMPSKNRRAVVNYVLACFALTRTHTGEGLDPAANPANSTGCTLGEYRLGEAVTLTASPAASWAVLNWSGTANDASSDTLNTISIPNSDRTVSVNYQQVCFDLILTHTGNGSNPVPSPASSLDCPSGKYRSGELITLSVAPSSGWEVGSWIGADENTLVDVSNVLTMPKGVHTVTVNYVEDIPDCYYLSTLSTGVVNNPIPSPIKSDACANNNYYVVDEVVNFTATLPAGYVVLSWQGTENDTVTSLTNSWVMTADNHVVVIDYAPILSKKIISVGKYDGWVLESSEFSNNGGSLNAGESTFNVGDDSANRQYRGILSFNTAGLPDDAKILSVMLKVRRQAFVGTSPFETHGRLRVDVRKPYFGSTVNLQLSDFQYKANKASVGSFGKPSSTGWYNAKLASTSFLYINTLGPTQFRLSFVKDDNNDNSADYVKFFSGNSTIARRPVLVITYYVP